MNYWSRTQAAREISAITGYEVDESSLRKFYEPDLVRLPFGELPIYDDVALAQGVYVATLRKAGHSLQAIKKTMREKAIQGGESGGNVATKSTAYDQLREAAREIQRDLVSRGRPSIPDHEAITRACAADPDLYQKYQAEVVAGAYPSTLHRQQLAEPPTQAQGGPALREVHRLREEKMKENPKLDAMAADRLVFTDRPDLYHAVNVEIARRKEASDATGR